MKSIYRSLIAIGVMLGVAGTSASLQAKTSYDNNGKPEPYHGTEVDG